MKELELVVDNGGLEFGPAPWDIFLSEGAAVEAAWVPNKRCCEFASR